MLLQLIVRNNAQYCLFVFLLALCPSDFEFLRQYHIYNIQRT